MAILAFLFKFAALALILNVLIRQTYNLVFFLAARPWTWVLIVTLVGFGTVALWGLLGWSHSVLSWACLVALFVNVAPGTRGGSAQADVVITVDDIYREMGIIHGMLKYRLGLLGFSVAAVAAYILFYGESCNAKGECFPLYRLLAGHVGG